MEKIYDLECRNSPFLFMTSREGEILGGSETYGEIISGEEFSDLHVLDMFCSYYRMCVM